MATATAAPEATNGHPAGGRIDPYRAYNFELQIGGSGTARFTECTGLAMRVQALSYREGGRGEVVRRIPGYVEYGDLTLRWGLSDSDEVWRWLHTAVSGNVERRDISVLLLKPDGVAEAMRWNLYAAWVCEWRGAPLTALGNLVAIQQATIVYEGLELVGGGGAAATAE